MGVPQRGPHPGPPNLCPAQSEAADETKEPSQLPGEREVVLDYPGARGATGSSEKEAQERRGWSLVAAGEGLHLLSPASETADGARAKECGCPQTLKV